MNKANAEVIWFAKSRRQHNLPSTGFNVGSDITFPSLSVCDVENFVDCDLMMKLQVSRTESHCFGALRQLRSVRRSLPLPCAVRDLVIYVRLTILFPDLGCDHHHLDPLECLGTTCQLSAADHSTLPPPESETLCRITSHLLPLCRCLAAIPVSIYEPPQFDHQCWG